MTDSITKPAASAATDAAAWLAEIHDLTSAVVAPAAAEGERTATFPGGIVRDLAARGVVAAGLGLEPRSGPAYRPAFYQALDALAGAWLAVAESLHLQTLTAIGLQRYGSPALREAYLDGMARFTVVGANCFSEPETGSDLARLTTTARRDGNHYVLDGTKTWVGHGTIADVLNVYCRTGGQGATGISCLLVDAATEGISVVHVHEKMGVQALPNATIRFDGVRVPRDRILGHPGRGLQIGFEVLRHGRLGLAACANGLARSAMRTALGHARTRLQFGHRILDFQGVSFALADMANRLAASDALLGAAVAATGTPDEALMASHAKLFASDAAMRTTTDAVQVLGAGGYERGSGVERRMREAKLLQIIGGTNEIQRVIISSGM
jgi:alkylation response protein AidB-like acyl-CoA dehydrogenase